MLVAERRAPCAFLKDVNILVQKVALVTGASGGIGQAIAKTLANRGYYLYLHYHQNELRMKELVKECKQIGVDFKVIKADLSVPNGVAVLIKQLEREVDAIVYTSGVSHYGVITETTEQTVEELVQIHLKSPFMLSQSLLPTMISKKNGSIVFISSIWGLTGGSCEVLYSMVKGGQNSFVKALAKEVALSGIRVNAVAPGAINTPMMADFSEEEIRHLRDDIPMGRIGDPNEVAEAVSFLLSSNASYITGQILSVNGGWYC